MASTTLEFAFRFSIKLYRPLLISREFEKKKKFFFAIFGTNELAISRR